MKIILTPLLVILSFGIAGAQDRPKPTGTKVDTVNGAFFVTKLVGGGTFKMGGKDREDQKPIHQVTLDSFYMGETEVTQAQWKAVMVRAPRELNNKGCDDCPVERVSWHDVQKFIVRLNAKTGKKYRLPTEAEWEYAARGGTNSQGFTYAGGNDLDAVGWYDENGAGTTHPVKGKKPNELGLYDMSGNVYEWCKDWYMETSYQASQPNNPECTKNATGKRVLRGGAWLVDQDRCKVSHRLKSVPKQGNFAFGFRLAMGE